MSNHGAPRVCVRVCSKLAHLEHFYIIGDLSQSIKEQLEGTYAYGSLYIGEEPLIYYFIHWFCCSINFLLVHKNTSTHAYTLSRLPIEGVLVESTPTANSHQPTTSAPIGYKYNIYIVINSMSARVFVQARPTIFLGPDVSLQLCTYLVVAKVVSLCLWESCCFFAVRTSLRFAFIFQLSSTWRKSRHFGNSLGQSVSWAVAFTVRAKLGGPHEVEVKVKQIRPFSRARTPNIFDVDYYHVDHHAE